jgi:hybrid polyketide synthase/nonribosomal peptide synthetase ACE1
MSTAPDSLVISTLALHLITQSIISSNATEEGTILIHDASEILRKAISKEATARGIQVAFTTSRKPAVKSSREEFEVYLHESFPRRLIEKLIPCDVVVFLDMSTADNPLGGLLRDSLPRHTVMHTTPDFIRAHTDSSRTTADGNIQQILKVACRLAARPTPDCLPVVSLADMGTSMKANTTPTIVDWKSSSNLTATVQAIDAGTIFRDNGTYWLLGMTGDLGISICHWMVRHGARHVVLSSRNPNVHPSSFESHEALGANIRIVSVDISNRKSLHNCHSKLQAELPPIIGVANATMVLDDSLFDEVQYGSIERAMLPKVEGSAFLDELFYSTPLDFFILFTSVANVVGTSGQLTYVMANCFMLVLAK